MSFSEFARRQERRLMDTCRNVYTKHLCDNQLKVYYCDCSNGYVLSPEMKREYIEYFRSFGFKDVSTAYLERIYGINGRYDKRYIPDDILNMYIDPLFPNIRNEWQNKSIQSKLLPDVTFPHTIVHCVDGNYLNEKYQLISEREAINIARKYERVVIKPSVITGGGMDVQFLDAEELTEAYLREYNKHWCIQKNFVIQELIEQSDTMAMFSKSSVNTLKIMSFLFHGEVHILGAFVRMGAAGVKSDNLSLSQDSLSVAVSADGTLHKCAYNGFMEAHHKTCAGVPLDNINIAEFYSSCVDTIKASHMQLPQFPIISWDFTEGCDGKVILVEYNIKQHTALQYQIPHGPLFGDLTDDVLREAAKVRDINKGLLYRFK